MFSFIFKKTVKNRWLSISLLVGYIIAIAVISSMPVYSHAILGRMLTKDLEKVQMQTGEYPGKMTVALNFYFYTSNRNPRRILDVCGESMQKDIREEMKVPFLRQDYCFKTSKLSFMRKGGMAYTIRDKAVRATYASDLEKHITFLKGQMPSAVPDNGIYEVVVSDACANSYGISYDTVYIIRENGNSSGEAIQVRIVGVFQMTDPADPYWSLDYSAFNDAIIFDPTVFSELFIDSQNPLLNSAIWYNTVDYSKISTENISSIISTVNRYSENNMLKIETVFMDMLEIYNERSASLTSMLWVLQIPIILMLALYIFMVSGLILDYEKNDIAVMRSRGASKRQILIIYVTESAILSLIALLIGPFLGQFLCRLIGSSNGFMEFVGRKALNVSLTGTSLLYALCTAILLVVTMVIAVLLTNDTSIVALKRKKSNFSQLPFWQKWFLDIALILISLYGYYTFRNRMSLIASTAVNGSDAPIDFMLYTYSTLFILGVTLLFLRIYPYIIRTVFYLGRRKWSPVLYTSLLNISRNSSQNLFISVFLIFTLSMGIYNSVAARTLNQNYEDRIYYSVGADIVVQEQWPGYSTTTVAVSNDPYAPTESVSSIVHYTEPSFSTYQKLTSAKNVARVLTESKLSLTYGGAQVDKVTLIGMIPGEFGKVTWSRSDLMEHHINAYLNLLSQNPRAVLLSNHAMEELGVKPGEEITVWLGKTSQEKTGVSFVVYAGIDYFPTFDNTVAEDGSQGTVVVANLSYIQYQYKTTPYAVWIKKADGATSEDVYQELTDAGVKIASIQNTGAQIIEKKNDAMTQGTNGYMTLSFLITILISMVGFFIYWILSIKGRMLQFGIIRSIGLSKGKVIMILFWEQILISFVAVFAGILIGTLGAELFAPMLELNSDTAKQIIPFRVYGNMGDYARIFFIVLAMIFLAMVILGRIISKMQISQALKLGED